MCLARAQISDHVSKLCTHSCQTDLEMRAFLFLTKVLSLCNFLQPSYMMICPPQAPRDGKWSAKSFQIWIVIITDILIASAMILFRGRQMRLVINSNRAVVIHDVKLLMSFSHSHLKCLFHFGSRCTSVFTKKRSEVSAKSNRLVSEGNISLHWASLFLNGATSSHFSQNGEVKDPYKNIRLSLENLTRCDLEHV